MEQNCFFLAADSGGSKTVWTLLNANGTPVSTCRTLGLGAIKEGLLPVNDIVEKAKQLLNPCAPLSRIFLMLGGPNVAEVKRALEAVWSGVPVTVEREACGDSVLRAAARFGCRAAVLCGTGSTAVGDTAAGRRYAGGWGPVYGDGGSGGGLGSQALRLFLNALDTGAACDGLAKVFAPLTEGLDLSLFADRMEVKARAAAISRRELAALAPKIYQLMEQGDAVAYSLYEQAAAEIASLAAAVCDHTAESTVLLCGGFLAEKPLLMELCHKAFQQLCCAKLKYIPAFSPLLAAQIAVLTQGNVAITDSMVETLLNDKM